MGERERATCATDKFFFLPPMARGQFILGFSSLTELSAATCCTEEEEAAAPSESTSIDSPEFGCTTFASGAGQRTEPTPRYRLVKLGL